MDDPRLEVSVSFGRFENDALSWEKWSSFSPNKYLEEVGNLSTPGSVAQKKAYFEAHYKQIAARKADELELENSAGPAFSSSDVIKEDCNENSTETNMRYDLFSGEKSVKEIDFSNETEGEINSSRPDDFDNVINSYDEKEDFVKCESLKIEVAKDEPSVDVELGRPELHVKKESVPVVLLETPQDSKDNVEKRPVKINGREQQASVLRKGNSKSSRRNITQKVTPIEKDKSSVTLTKKKIVSPLPKGPKPLEADATRYSKPTLISTRISTSQPLKKKVNGSHTPKNNNAPTSLHMSLSLDPTNSVGELSMTRKSLIMEKMGDKDIVKRAFKTFQNRTNGLKADEKPSTVKHVSCTALEPKVSSFHTPTKGNVGRRKDTVKTATPSSLQGIKPNLMPSGVHKSFAPSRKTTMAFSPSTALKSDEKSVQRKEFLKKLEAKSIAREASNAQLRVESRASERPTLSR